MKEQNNQIVSDPIYNPNREQHILVYKKGELVGELSIAISEDTVLINNKDVGFTEYQNMIENVNKTDDTEWLTINIRFLSNLILSTL